MSGCIGYTDSTMTVSCTHPVTGECRVIPDGGDPGPWQPVCTVHGDATMSILNTPAVGYTAQRRPAAGGD